jgi:hypothetical protein
MRFKRFVPLFLALPLIFGAVARAQDQDEEGVRGAFLSSRPSAGAGASAGLSSSSGGNAGAGVNVSTGRRSRRRSNAGKSTAKVTATTNKNTSGTSKSTTTTSNTNVAVKAVASAPIGLGYTLYMRDANGDAVRVDPARDFRTGERVRLSMETSADSYLYIFNSTDNGDPVMIYPDVRLDDAGNYIEAHMPTEIPSSTEADERLRWFAFDATPGIEHLYIVVSRDPLPGIPIEDALVSYCRSNRCPWRPAPGVWAQIKAAMNGRVQVVKSKTYGQAQTAGEREATTRGLGLDQSAPPPSVIRMNVSSDTGILVTSIDLAHR